MPLSTTVIWRVSEGDVLRVRIYREPDLSGESVVAVNGTAYFTGLGRLHVAGLTLDSLQSDIAARYGAFLVDAAVDVVLQRNVVVYGQARASGIYLVDASTTVLGLLSKAGGTVSQGPNPVVTLVKPDGRRLLLPQEGRLSMMDITSTDAVYVQEGSFFARNQSSLTAASLAVSIATSVVGLLVILSR